MKCQMCGKSEADFHYTSNINGCVTQSNLCAQCAQNAGYNFSDIFNFGSMFQSFGAGNSIFPASVPMIGFGTPVQAVLKPYLVADGQAHGGSVACGCGRCNQTSEAAVEVDEDMKKRRELYREMQLAAENEEFERAAQIRDEIKAMEPPGVE